MIQDMQVTAERGTLYPQGTMISDAQIVGSHKERDKTQSKHHHIQKSTPHAIHRNLLDLRIKCEKPNSKPLEENTGKSYSSLETGKDFSKKILHILTLKRKETGHLLPLKLGSFKKKSTSLSCVQLFASP